MHIYNVSDAVLLFQFHSDRLRLVSFWMLWLVKIINRCSDFILGQIHPRSDISKPKVQGLFPRGEGDR